MKPKATPTLLLALLALAYSPHPDPCLCDKNEMEKAILELPFQPTLEIKPLSLYTEVFRKLDAEENRTLWYDEIQYPNKTCYTALWDDYGPDNYHASHRDFRTYFKERDDVDLAFQFGPNHDLWAYHTFTVKRYGCCFIATRSYFRHARFTYKAYAILNPSQVDSLYEVIYAAPQKKPSQFKTSYSYRGVFRDNRKDSAFYIDFDGEMDTIPSHEQYTKLPDGKADTVLIEKHVYKQEIIRLFEHVDSKIKWIKTYGL